MSEENVEVVRRGYAAFAEKGVEGAIPFFTEDAVIYSIPEETKGSAVPEWPVHHWPVGLRHAAPLARADGRDAFIYRRRAAGGRCCLPSTSAPAAGFNAAG